MVKQPPKGVNPSTVTQLRDDNPPTSSLASLAMSDVASTAGIKDIQMIAWRDLDDPEAGGSEVHAATIARIWSESGIGISMRTSSVRDRDASRIFRDGYRVHRGSGRYSLFPQIAFEGLAKRLPTHDALVEIWNGMPFFSPLWSRKPSVVFLHHVHAEMWKLVLSNRLAKFGWFLEAKVAPKVYRNSRIITLSQSSREEIVDLLGLSADQVSVVPPGVAPHFSPSHAKSADPLILGVGRLVPVKRFDKLIEAVSKLKSRHPKLKCLIVGEGYERPALEAFVRQIGAMDWISLPGRLDDAQLVDLYRSSWLLASCSQREGWGMTITEAAACGTPAVVTDIAGHSDAVDVGKSGFLASDAEEFVAHMDSILSDADLRSKLSDGAARHASRFSWEATARGAMEELALEAIRNRS